MTDQSGFRLEVRHVDAADASQELLVSAVRHLTFGSVGFKLRYNCTPIPLDRALDQ
jgi:hypothetical protein